MAVCNEHPQQWPSLPSGCHDTLFLQMRPGDLRLRVANIGRFRISNGDRIAWHRETGDVNDQDLRTYLLSLGAQRC